MTRQKQFEVIREEIEHIYDQNTELMEKMSWGLK